MKSVNPRPRDIGPDLYTHSLPAVQFHPLPTIHSHESHHDSIIPRGIAGGATEANSQQAPPSQPPHPSQQRFLTVSGGTGFVPLTVPSRSLPSIPSLPSISSLRSIQSIGGLTSGPSIPSNLGAIVAGATTTAPTTTTTATAGAISNGTPVAGTGVAGTTMSYLPPMAVPNLPPMGGIQTVPRIPSLPSMRSNQSFPSISSFSSLQGLINGELQSVNGDMHRSHSVRSNLSSLGSASNPNLAALDQSTPNAYGPPIDLPATPHANTPSGNGMGHQLNPQQVLALMDAATNRTMLVTDDLVSKHRQQELLQQTVPAVSPNGTAATSSNLAVQPQPPSQPQPQRLGGLVNPALSTTIPPAAIGAANPLNAANAVNTVNPVNTVNTVQAVNGGNALNAAMARLNVSNMHLAAGNGPNGSELTPSRVSPKVPLKVHDENARHRQHHGNGPPHFRDHHRPRHASPHGVNAPGRGRGGVSGYKRPPRFVPHGRGRGRHSGGRARDHGYGHSPNRRHHRDPHSNYHHPRRFEMHRGGEYAMDSMDAMNAMNAMPSRGAAPENVHRGPARSRNEHGHGFVGEQRASPFPLSGYGQGHGHSHGPQDVATVPAERDPAAGGGERKEEEDNKNPWFNEEIAVIVKQHRKTIRKYHRSKTKKVELKQQCKELEKKKRKLIKAAKQRHQQHLLEMAAAAASEADPRRDTDSKEMEMNSKAKAAGKAKVERNSPSYTPSTGTEDRPPIQRHLAGNGGNVGNGGNGGTLSGHDQREQSTPSTAMVSRLSGSTEEEKREDSSAGFPKTHIENLREVDASLIPNVDIPQFFKRASKQIFQICDDYL